MEESTLDKIIERYLMSDVVTLWENPGNMADSRMVVAIGNIHKDKSHRRKLMGEAVRVKNLTQKEVPLEVAKPPSDPN